MDKFIRIKGAREHNLKNIDVDIPKNKLTVITGLSGSGKSSLAFDTIYAEGQRRYVESLSSYARQFLDLMSKPDVDSIEGLSPAISIEQKTTSHNPRSTVGTVTEIFDYMRLLWARVGTPYSPVTGLPIESQTISQMVDRTLELPIGTKVMLLSLIARGKKGEFKKEINDLQKQGFQRLKIDGKIYDIENAPELKKNFKHDIEVVVDRLVIKDGIMERLTQSFETAIKLSDGLACVESADGLPLPLRERAGVRGSDYASESSHRVYSPYIKEFARSLRKNKTPQEEKLWKLIRNNQLGYKFRRQYAIDNKYIADFVCLEKKLIIELDGGQHSENAKDAERTTYIEKQDFRIVRFWNNEIDENIEGCLQKLVEELKDGFNPSPQPSPARGEGAFTPSSKLTFSSKFACPECGFTIEEIEPRLFSFNNPQGACPSCDGIGAKLSMDPDLIVPNPELSLSKGAIAPWSFTTSPFYHQTLSSLAEFLNVSINTSWKDIPKEAQNIILYGSGNVCVPMVYSKFVTDKPFEGVIPNMERRFLETDSAWVREEFAKYQSASPCETCNGKRLKAEALAVKIDMLDIMDASEFSIKKALDWFAGLEKKLSPKKREIAHKILNEIVERLTFLNSVGLDYLSLSRQSGTLSGGEAQRIRLASQIGSGLTGVLYVLDEPSIGLHQRDNDRLLATLNRLRDLGNSVIVVEHDEDAIRAADYLIDMGPAAGVLGGKIVAEGTVKEVLKNKNSLTAQYLNGEKEISVPAKRRKGNGKTLEIKGVKTNNLKNISAKIPLGTLTCITGVSGGGKSSLIIETLFKALNKELNGSREPAGIYDKIIGIENIDKVIDIDQSPIGRTPRSNPATYTGLFTYIRDWFAGLPEAKARGYKAGRFSFNVAGGRCEACVGDGVTKIEMHFLPDVYVECDVCKGKRFNRETLEVKYKGHSIADVLDMSVDEAYKLFEAIPSIKNRLELLQRVGLGYIKLGQNAVTLSGGEAQRIKLSKELSKRATGKTLYILDEPTTGLHFEDINRLLKVLQDLVNQGNSIIVIEHNLDVIKTADYIIDMGPEGGDGGGKIVAQGTPEEVVKKANGYTYKYLKEKL